MIDKWIFIGGAPRSGTSLLQAIFNQHSNCTSPPESHILETFAYAPKSYVKQNFYDRKKLLEYLLNDKWIPRLNINAEEIVASMNQDEGPHELFRKYIYKYAAVSGKRVLVEGSPINIWYLKKLHIDFPGCYILHIVRDPRDVVLSTLKAGYNKQFDFPLPEIARQYLDSYLQAERFRHLYGSRYLKMYYEDLVTQPEKTIRDICRGLGLEFEASMLNFQKSSGQVAAREEDWKENLSRPLISDNFGKWKKEMAAEDVIRIEYICSEFFRIEKDHYRLSGYGQAIAPKFRALFPLYIKNGKMMLRKLGGMKTNPDLMPPYERMRAAGLTKPD